MLAIVGAGGHAKAAYECFYTGGSKIIGFYDDDLSKHGTEIINGCKVLGSSESLIGDHRVTEVFVAIGENRARLEKYLFYGKENKFKFPNAVHVRAHISPFARVGRGVFIMGASIVNPAASVGDYCIINTSATVDHDCQLGRGVQVGPGVNLGGGSILEEGVFIGMAACVAPGVRIGAWSVVGAGSVVLTDIPPGTFCYGAPARVKKKINSEGRL